MTATITEGYRTRLRPGSRTDYVRIHAAIPAAVSTALHRSGLVSWRIWIDDDTLFHTIETRDGREAMIARMTALGPIDPAWDALIDTLVDPSPESSAVLQLVWESVLDVPTP